MIKPFDFVPVGLTCLSIILSLFIHVIMPIIRIVPQPYNSVGYVIFFGGLFFAAYSIMVLVRYDTAVRPAGSPKRLVTKGPYSISRNPIYLADMMMSLGVAILLSSLSALIGPLFLYWALNRYVIPKEEKKMNQTFGNEFRKYENRVNRWI